MSELSEFLGRPKVKRIYDWNRHCYVTAEIYTPASRSTQAASQTLPRKPLALADRVYFFLKWYGPQTARQLAQILIGNVKNKALVRMVTELEKGKQEGRFVVVGTRTIKGLERKLWGIRDA
jgi:hypothetical protein